MIYFIGKKVNYPGVENSTIEYLLEYFSNKAINSVGFDTETEGFDVYLDKILSYQFGDKDNQFVIDARLYPIKLVSSLLTDSNREILIHNAKFDLQFLYHQGIYTPKVWDTYLGECVLYKGNKAIRRSLEATVYRYFNYILNKSIRGKISKEGFTERVIKYCAEDVQYLPDIRSFQYNNFVSQGLINSMALENLFVRVLAYIEYCGIKVDTNLWTKKIEQDRYNLENSLKKLNSWVIDNNLDSFIETQLDLFSSDKKVSINWSSPKQVIELFTKLGIDTQIIDDKSGELKDSVEANVIERQQDKSTIIPLYLTYKKHEKILSTYGESVLDKIHPLTGRIHTSFTQIMNTGRLSSGGKKGGKGTINIQNIPRLPEGKERVKDKLYERECFVPEEGNVFIDADYIGQENIVFANWTKDKDILNFYKKDLGDMHSFIAQKIYPHLKDIPLKTIKSKYKDERQKAKEAGFAIQFGGDGNTISKNLNIPKEEGNIVYNAYFEAFPGVKDYAKKVAKQALHDGYILFNNISGGRSFIEFFDTYKKLESKIATEGFWNMYKEEKGKDSYSYKNELKPLVSKYFRLRGKIERLALDYPIQGSAAEISKLAAVYIFDYIIRNGFIGVVKFCNVIHDEDLLECPKGIADIIQKAVEQCMERAGKVYCKVVPLKVESKIANFWDH